MLKVVKKQRGFSLLEMIIVISVLMIAALVSYAFVHQSMYVPTERMQIKSSKNVLMIALNQYYVDNYKAIKKDPKSYASIPISKLISEHYINQQELYTTGDFSYAVGIRAGTSKIPNQLEVKIITKKPSDFSWMNPTEIDKGAVTWLKIPSYRNIAGTLKLNAVDTARFYDDQKM